MTVVKAEEERDDSVPGRGGEGRADGVDPTASRRMWKILVA
jgi:hypothetical protein